MLDFLKHTPQRVPFTLLFVCVMILANYLAGTLDGLLSPGALHMWGLNLQKLLDGELYRLATATFLSHSFAMFLRQIIFVIAIVGFYEWHYGTMRTAVLFALCDIIGTILVFAIVIAPLAQTRGGLESEIAALGDVGMSAGGFGLIGALCRLSSRPWLSLALIAVLIVMKMIWKIDLIADSAHLICLGLGFVLQSLVTRRDSEKGGRLQGDDHPPS